MQENTIKSDFQKLHDMLCECVAANVDDHLCFPAEWADEANVVHLECEGWVGFELDSLNELPCEEVEPGLFEIRIAIFPDPIPQKLTIQPLFGAHQVASFR